MKTYLRGLVVLLATFSLAGSLSAQISVSGVSHRTVYTDQATFTVNPQAGFTTVATLNGAPVPVATAVPVDRMDHYELIVTATPQAGGAAVSQMIQFIVRDADRGSPETGLIKWVPYPPIPSAQGEYAGAQLELVSPPAYPRELDIPFIALVTDNQGHARRVNGQVNLEGGDLQDFRLVRGSGFGLSRTTNQNTFAYSASVGGLTTSKIITMQAPAWTAVSGVLPAVTSWVEDSRMSVNGNLTVPAGGVLEIEAGTVIRLLPGVNITNNGSIVLRGSKANPIVFTSTNRVAPEVHTHAWGGFVMRNAGAEIVGEGAIFTGSGASTSFSFSPGTSHRSEQALFLVQAGTRVQLTNCFAINNAGQIANGYNADVTYDHCLLQKAITAGEYVGGTIIVNHSSVIEFPSIDDVYNAQIADSDYDGIYFTTGTHILMNSLFGFAKDDAIDSGSGGAGTVVVTNCWVESALHEALAWSGGGRETWTYDTILLNSGQGIECGWSTGTDSPLCRADRLLSLGNSVGARYGDNYEGTTGLGLKTGFLWVTNALILNNYRDVWGRVWDDTWNYRVGRMDLRSNFLTAANTNHPDNAVWNPATDADRLTPFLRTPVAGGVGVGLAVWSRTLPMTDITNGIPVRLSTFTPSPVLVDYALVSTSGVIQSGTVRFAPGEMVRRIPVTVPNPLAFGTLRLELKNPVGGELTGQTAVWYTQVPPTSTTLIPRGATWKYLDTGVDAGTAWRATSFDDANWLSGAAELGYGDGGEATVVRSTNSTGGRIITTYFRKAFTIADPAAFGSVGIWLLRDDAGVVYLNGTEVFRSPNLPASPTAILFNTLASSTGEDTEETATASGSLLVAGNNVVAVEIHQQSATSSDVSFNLELTGIRPTPPATVSISPFGAQLLLEWTAAGYVLEAAPTVSGPWSLEATASPHAVTPESSRFFRLRK